MNGSVDRHEVNILIVDPHMGESTTLQTILERDGYSVTVATDVHDSLKLAQETTPSLIFLENRSADDTQGGVESLREILRGTKRLDIPVIISLHPESIKIRNQALGMGAQDYVIKPYHMVEISSKVQRLLQYRHANQRIVDLQTEQAEQIRERESLAEAQHAMLLSPEDVPNANFQILYRSLNEAGGDFYDALELSKHVYGFFLADVAGHSLATGFITAALKSLIRQTCNAYIDPIKSMKDINKVLLKVLQPGQYLTAVYCVVNHRTGEVHIVNMGHPPVVYLPTDDSPILIEQEGDVLGAFENVEFGLTTLNYLDGDRFILYTDGIVEYDNSQVWSAGLDGLLEIVDEVRGAHLDQLPKKIYQSCFLKHDPDDDVVIMAVETRSPLVDELLSDEIDFEIESSRGTIDPTVDQVFNFLETHIPMVNSFEVKLILFEAIGNAVIHGNQEDPNKTVKIWAQVLAGSFMIRIEDQGTGFDWKKRLEDSLADPDMTHGRGIRLMLSYEWKINYNEAGNILELEKSF